MYTSHFILCCTGHNRDYRRLYKDIKAGYVAGGSYTFPGDGTVVQYDDIMEPQRTGRKASHYY
jgi:hypothetical protein